MDVHLDDLKSDNDDEDELCLGLGDDHQQPQHLDLCLVRRFLANRAINFNFMQNRMASIWCPGKEVRIGVRLPLQRKKKIKCRGLNGSEGGVDSGPGGCQLIQAGAVSVERLNQRGKVHGNCKGKGVVHNQTISHIPHASNLEFDGYSGTLDVNDNNGLILDCFEERKRRREVVPIEVQANIIDMDVSVRKDSGIMVFCLMISKKPMN
ncbi:hypothetical protein PTKIN_Ptkin08bG0031500 [Pterospermum kingtungense]